MLQPRTSTGIRQEPRTARFSGLQEWPRRLVRRIAARSLRHRAGKRTREAFSTLPGGGRYAPAVRPGVSSGTSTPSRPTCRPLLPRRPDGPTTDCSIRAVPRRTGVDSRSERRSCHRRRSRARRRTRHRCERHDRSPVRTRGRARAGHTYRLALAAQTRHVGPVPPQLAGYCCSSRNGEAFRAVWNNLGSETISEGSRVLAPREGVRARLRQWLEPTCEDR